jgi:ATP-dependent exoDNAse (exonuclease V) beta subunit
VEHDGRPEGSVRPGRHHFDDGDYDVIWWDPSTLELAVEINLGLGQEGVLREDEGGAVAMENLTRYRRWQTRQGEIRAAGAAPSFEVLAVTELEDEPPGEPAVVTLEARSDRPPRPAGPRFGTLVHTVLRDVDLAARRDAVEEMTRLHGRLLDASGDEVAAAVEAVVGALAHPLLERARGVAGESGRCFREAPFLVPLDETRVLEGTVDLAFLEPEGWVVVDFKTDAGVAERRAAYARQIAWYLYALERLTGSGGTGSLLEV